jgi:APA family basic amino acid/polyamine antiporter
METASTTIAELKDPHKDAPKAMSAAAIGGVIAYCIVPFVMLGIVGVTVLSQDASVAFLPAAQAIFGHIGGILVSVMLITALLLGVQSSIIGSSRCMYEMTHDGQMIKQFGLVNKFGVPIGSMFVDMTVTLLMLFIFKANVVSLIAASNVGYVIVFIILVPAYVVLRARHKDDDHAIKLPSFLVPIAVLITIFNVLLLFVAGPQWDTTPVASPVIFGHTVDLTVMGLGWTLMGLLVPFYLYRTLVQDKKEASFGYSGPATPLPELQEGEDDLGGRREVVHAESTGTE